MPAVLANRSPVWENRHGTELVALTCVTCVTRGLTFETKGEMINLVERIAVSLGKLDVVLANSLRIHSS